MGFLCIGLVLVISSLIHWFSNLVKRKKKKIATKPRNQCEKERKEEKEEEEENRERCVPDPAWKTKKKKKKITCVGESKKSNRGSLNVCVFTKMSS